ncbi:MAG: aminotransferase class I/II-fold pyridoxal phosphate-dependent enzyme [Caulobacterales bacterium]|nr:aminotransferase class I/II-fold pyridoxal phosphate-dependent enzyme [Caulobacterales bacterium]
MTDTTLAPASRAMVAGRAAGLPQSSTVRIADLAARLRRAGEAVIDLSAGRAAEATAPAICRAAAEAMTAGDTHQTPARGAPAYLAAVADKLRRENDLEVDPDREVMATLGCKNGLTLALMAALDPGDEVIVEDPCFVSYGPTITLAGGTAKAAPLRRAERWTWDAAALEAAVTPRTKAILFCSPGNPTGTVHARQDLQAIADIAIRHDLLVIADEIYEALAWGGRRHLPIRALPGMAERTIGLMGMTKSYAMGGWRIGYAYAPAPLIERMTMVQQHLMTCASSIGQAAGARALSAEVTGDLRHGVWRDWEARCERFCRALDAMPGLSVAPPEGGYYAWADISGAGLGSEAFATRLLEEAKIAAVPGETFGPSCDDFVRLTCVKSWSDVEEASGRIDRFCRSLVTA